MDDLRKEIIEALPKKSKLYRNTNWMQTPCPKCDSNSKKMHLHIHLEEGKPIIYKCFRAGCNTAGMLNRHMGRKLGFSSSLNARIEEEAVKYSKYTTSHKYYGKSKDYDLGPLDSFAVDYFFDRTGKDLYDYQEQLRICSNMSKFVDANDIDRRKVNMLLRWEYDGGRFIYFFNDAFSTVFYREIYGENRKGRLNIISANDGETLLHKPYIIQAKGDIDLSPYFDTVILAEGPFDIINTYFHVAPKNINATFISVAGLANMKSIILEYAKYHYKPKIFVVSDRDVAPSWYRHYLLKRIDERIAELVVFYNRNAHDVGDITEGLDIQRIVIKDLDPLLVDDMILEEMEEKEQTLELKE